jgi:hypothetical protein
MRKKGRKHKEERERQATVMRRTNRKQGGEGEARNSDGKKEQETVRSGRGRKQ